MTDTEVLYNTFDARKTAPLLMYLDVCFPIWADYGWCIGWCDISRDFSLWRKSVKHQKEYRWDYDLRPPGARVDEAIIMGLRAVAGQAVAYRQRHPGKQAIDEGWLSKPFNIEHALLCHELDDFMRKLPGCWWQFRRESNGDVVMNGGIQPSSPFAPAIDINPDLFGRNSHSACIEYNSDHHARMNASHAPAFSVPECVAARCVRMLKQQLMRDISMSLPATGSPLLIEMDKQ